MIIVSDNRKRSKDDIDRIAKMLLELSKADRETFKELF